ncbi:MAG: DbpA RNA binding domain-containing protein [Spirochaetes bacterium]|jgi:ATP-dependent RNA helicase DeaD|nr:DbpA RNA binding domain-containing protein [Spirochaetota bacterium]
MSQEKKLERILETALTEDLSDYRKVLKALKKKLPFMLGTKRVALALLKETLGDVSKLDISLEKRVKKSETGKIFFEDIKDGKARLFINIGKNHRMSPGDLIREIVKRTGIEGKQIGKIDIYSSYSFFEVPEQLAELVLLSLDKQRIKGVPIVVEPAKKKKEKEGK